MTTSLQPGILALGVRTHHYLEFDLLDGVDAPAALRAASGGLGESRATTGGVNVVVGFGRSLWAAIDGVPADLADAETLVGPDGFTMPATQHDVWVWVSGATTDGVFDTARSVAAAFADVATVASERAGFTYHDSRDLSGFVDGTENPPINEAASAISIPADVAGAGGSIVLVQRWIHDLAAFHALDVEEQERIIGRTKDTDEELDDDIRPETSHISRVVIEEDGEELEVFRRSTPYGDVGEHGLMFVAFSQDHRRLDLMLKRMVGLDGPRDAITTWSTPVGGAYYYVPPAEAFASDDD